MRQVMRERRKDGDRGHEARRQAVRNVNGMVPGSRGRSGRRMGGAPERKPISEETKAVDEKQKARFERIRRAIRAQGDRFAGQGTIVASWKTHKGKRLGPYYRVAYRVEGKQKSLYLGASRWLVAQVRELLASLQSAHRQYRMLQRLKRQARRALADSKRHVARLLQVAFGTTMKGWEFRGVFRALRQRATEHDQQAHAARAAEAQRVIRGESEGTWSVGCRAKGAMDCEMTFKSAA